MIEMEFTLQDCVRIDAEIEEFDCLMAEDERLEYEEWLFRMEMRAYGYDE